MDNNRLYFLIQQYYSDKLTPEEKEELAEIFLSENNQVASNTIAQLSDWMQSRESDNTNYENERWNSVLHHVLQTDQYEKGIAPVVPLVANQERKYLKLQRYAAAILLLIGMFVAIYFALNQKESIDLSSILSSKNLSDITPGKEMAILTLSDGRKVLLDSTGEGVIAQQGSVSVVKTTNGEILYNTSGTKIEELVFNTMSTPKGGQYKLILPDGSKVWLNAASSIHYPTSFSKQERKVTVTGEVYIEVAPDASKPFLVSVDNKMTVQALGTEFNIRSYPDDKSITTTLIEGKVRVWNADQAGRENEIVLTPGQQAIREVNSNSNTIVKKNISSKNIEQVMAWKNGYFDFDSVSIVDMARQIERWYDVKFNFTGEFKDVELRGKMDRGVQLADIIKFFNDYGFKTTLTGREVNVRK